MEEVGGGDHRRANADANTQDTIPYSYSVSATSGNQWAMERQHTNTDHTDTRLSCPHTNTLHKPPHPARIHAHTHAQLIHTTPTLPPRPRHQPRRPAHTHVSDALALLAMPGIAGRPPPGARFSVTIPGVPAGPARCPTRAWGEVSSCISPPCRPWNRRNGLGRSIPSADTSADAASRRAERRTARQDVMVCAEDEIRVRPCFLA